MNKLVIYIIGTIVINCMVIGEPFWELITSNLWTAIRDGNTDALSGYYDNLSFLQVAVTGICEFMLLLFLLSGNKEDEAKDTEPEATGEDEKGIDNE